MYEVKLSMRLVHSVLIYKVNRGGVKQRVNPNSL
jgi:hypothetical protein